MTAAPTQIVAVSGNPRRLAAQPAEVWLSALASELPRVDGPRFIFLPPLIPNLAGLPTWTAGLALSRASRLAAALRPLRSAAARFAYPRRPGRLAWIAMHDRVERVYRDVIGAFARRTDSTVVTTALQGHPRQHWEMWPDEAGLYHVAKAMGPDGEPAAMVRQRRPRAWALLRDMAIDPHDGALSPLLETSAGTVGISWDSTPLALPLGHAAPTMMWSPRASVAGETWATRQHPARILRDAASSCRLAVQTALVGQMGPKLVGETWIASRAAQGEIAVTQTRRPVNQAFTWTQREMP